MKQKNTLLTKAEIELSDEEKEMTTEIFRKFGSIGGQRNKQKWATMSQKDRDELNARIIATRKKNKEILTTNQMNNA